MLKSQPQYFSVKLCLDIINTDHNMRVFNAKRGLTVHFIQDELVSGEVQFSQVQVSDVSIGLLEKPPHTNSLICLSCWTYI